MSCFSTPLRMDAREDRNIVYTYRLLFDQDEIQLVRELIADGIEPRHLQNLHGAGTERHRLYHLFQPAQPYHRSTDFG